MFNIPWRKVIFSKIIHESHGSLSWSCGLGLHLDPATSSGTGVCEWAVLVQSKPPLLAPPHGFQQLVSLTWVWMSVKAPFGALVTSWHVTGHPRAVIHTRLEDVMQVPGAPSGPPHAESLCVPYACFGSSFHLSTTPHIALHVATFISQYVLASTH